MSLIRGGRQTNMVPDSCTIDIDRRLNPGETWEQAYKAIQKGLSNGLSGDEKSRVLFSRPYLIDPSMETDPSSGIVAAFSGVLQAHGLPHRPVGLPYGCDASKIALLGIPTIVFGPGRIEEAHSQKEFVDRTDVVKAARIYRDFILT